MGSSTESGAHQLVRQTGQRALGSWRIPALELKAHITIPSFVTYMLGMCYKMTQHRNRGLGLVRKLSGSRGPRFNPSIHMAAEAVCNCRGSDTPIQTDICVGRLYGLANFSGANYPGGRGSCHCWHLNTPINQCKTHS